MVLAGATHDEQVAATEVVADRTPPAARAETEWAAIADADDGDVGLGQPRAAQIAVPRHGVVTVAIPVEPDRVELDSIARAEGPAGVAEDGQRLAAGGTTPPRRQPWLGEPALVHRHGALLPGQHVDEGRERVVGAGQPVGGEVDPAARVELPAAQLCEGAVDADVGVAEQRTLEHAFDASALTGRGG